MSAELLRKTAALMRSRAEAATPGPWRVENIGSHGRHSWALDIARWRNHTNVVGFDEDRPTAEHIASWHPVVALAVADWLERVASDEPSWGYAHAEKEMHSALRVARAYLGEES